MIVLQNNTITELWLCDSDCDLHANPSPGKHGAFHLKIIVAHSDLLAIPPLKPDEDLFLYFALDNGIWRQYDSVPTGKKKGRLRKLVFIDRQSNTAEPDM